MPLPLPPPGIPSYSLISSAIRAAAAGAAPDYAGIYANCRGAGGRENSKGGIVG